ncbi:hypothetical protein D3C85_1747620 [compost metagenome]
MRSSASHSPAMMWHSTTSAMSRTLAMKWLVVSASCALNHTRANSDSPAPTLAPSSTAT